MVINSASLLGFYLSLSGIFSKICFQQFFKFSFFFGKQIGPLLCLLLSNRNFGEFGACRSSEFDGH